MNNQLFFITQCLHNRNRCRPMSSFLTVVVCDLESEDEADKISEKPEDKDTSKGELGLASYK